MPTAHIRPLDLLHGGRERNALSAKLIEKPAIGLTWVMDEANARASHALVSDGRVWIVDPVEDDAALERVGELGEPVSVLQLLDRHNRDCRKVAERFGIPHVLLPLELRNTPFEAIEVVDNRVWKERALWWRATQTLVVAEAIGTSPMFRPCAAGAGVHVGLRLNPPRAALGSYLPRHLLVGHGDPIHGQGAARALEEALSRSRRDLPGALLTLPGALLGRAARP